MYFRSQSGLSDFWQWTHLNLITYIRSGARDLSDPFTLLWRLGALLLAAGASLIPMAIHGRQNNYAYAALAFILSVCMVIGGGFFFYYYILFMIPSVCWLVGCLSKIATTRTLDRGSRRWLQLGGISFGLVVVYIAASSAAVSLLRHHAPVSGKQREYQDDLEYYQAAGVIAEARIPGDTVWSFKNCAWMAWYLGDRAPTRYLLAAEHITRSLEPAREEEEYARGFLRVAPTFFVTANTQDDLIPSELREQIAYSYEQFRTIGWLDVYVSISD
jgi:hypothetical protein